MEVSGQLHGLVTLPMDKKTPGSRHIRGWVGPKTGLNAMENRKFPSPCWELHPAGSLITILI